MESYYILLLTVILLFQVSLKGFVLNLICIISTILRIYGVSYLDYLGAGFYQSAIYTEGVILTLAITTLPLHKSTALLLVVNLSLVINLVLGIEDSGIFVFLIHEHVEWINIGLFECLVYLCLKYTWVYSWFRYWFYRINLYVKNKINKMLERKQ